MLSGFHFVRDLGFMGPIESLSTGKSKELEPHHSPDTPAKFYIFSRMFVKICLLPRKEDSLISSARLLQY